MDCIIVTIYISYSVYARNQLRLVKTFCFQGKDIKKTSAPQTNRYCLPCINCITVCRLFNLDSTVWNYQRIINNKL
jgi:hypothetical protein